MLRRRARRTSGAVYISSSPCHRRRQHPLRRRSTYRKAHVASRRRLELPTRTAGVTRPFAGWYLRGGVTDPRDDEREYDLPDTRPRASKSRRSWILASVAMAAIAAPLAISFAYVRAFAVDVLIWDEWEIVNLFMAKEAGRLSLHDLFAQHNEHRILLPRLAWLLLGPLTRLDNRAEMYLSWSCLAAIVGLVLVAHLRSEGTSARSIASFIPAAWVICTLRQSENLLWGWQIAISLCAVFAVLAVFALARAHTVLSVSLAIVAGTATSLCFAGGLVIWPVGACTLALTMLERDQVVDKRRVRAALVSWVIAGAVCCVAYFHGYIKPAHHPSLRYVFGNPVESMTYFAMAFSNSLATSFPAAIAYGAVLLLALVAIAALVWHRLVRVSGSMAIPLVLFSVASSAVIMLGRAGFGRDQALSSRYATFSALGVVGLYLAALQAHRIEMGRLISTALLTIIVVSQLTIDVGAWHEALPVKESRRIAAQAVLDIDAAPDQTIASYLYPVAAITRVRARFLRDHRWNVFAKSSAPSRVDGRSVYAVDAVAAGQQTLDREHGIPEVPKNSFLKVVGWAVDAAAGVEASGVIVCIDGRPAAFAAYGLQRPDVAEALRNRRFRDSGFDATVPSSQLGSGIHELSLRVLTHDGKHYIEPDYRMRFRVP